MKEEELITAKEAKEAVDHNSDFRRMISYIDYSVKEAIAKNHYECEIRLNYLKDDKDVQDKLVNLLKDKGYTIVVARQIDDYFFININWRR